MIDITGTYPVPMIERGFLYAAMILDCYAKHIRMMYVKVCLPPSTGECFDSMVQEITRTLSQFLYMN